MGVSLEEREKIAVPEADPFTHEPHPVIRQQVRICTNTSLSSRIFLWV